MATRKLLTHGNAFKRTDAQTDIKNALQNKKSDDANTKADDNKDNTTR